MVAIAAAVIAFAHPLDRGPRDRSVAAPTASGHHRARAAAGRRHVLARRIGQRFNHRVFAWMLGAGGTGAPAAGTLPVPVPKPPVRCDLHVASREALVAAAQAAANDGRVVCADAADYGAAALRLSVRHDAMLTLHATPGQHVTLPYVGFYGVDDVRIEGFDMPRGGFETGQGTANHHIELVGNEIHDCFCEGLHLLGSDSDVLFQGNHVHGIHYDGDWRTGWGIKTDGPTTGLHVRYNTFDDLENDAGEIGGTTDSDWIGNVVSRIHPPADYPDPHADGLMLWDGSSRWLIRDNRWTDTDGLLMSGVTDVVMENNLVAHVPNLCFDGGTSGSSDAGLVRLTWIRNTMYDCGSYWDGGGFGGAYGLLSDGPATAGASNVAVRNLLASLDYDTRAQFAVADHNLIQSPGGGDWPFETNLVFTPSFADRVDYRPANLPAGYGDVGYRPAPAGYRAAP
jgi:hypothetical protein